MDFVRRIGNAVGGDALRSRTGAGLVEAEVALEVKRQLTLLGTVACSAYLRG